MKRKSIIYLGVALISFVLLNGNVRAEENIQLTDTDIESIGDNDAVKSEMHFGWLLVDSKWYYFEEPNMEHPGVMVKDCVMTIGDGTYFFDSNGCMLTGWIRKPEGWYYADESGRMVKGWKYINGAYYYFDAANEEHPGLMLCDGKYEIEGDTYFFEGGGCMLRGWIREPEGWYYADDSGRMAKGWRYVNGAYYYLDGSNQNYPGLMLCDGKYEIEGEVCFFEGGGCALTGWIREPEGWYYADSNGRTARGWRYVNGAYYYLDGNNQEYPGLMVCDGKYEIEVDTYFFEGGGCMLTGWIREPEGWYYADPSGRKAQGWRYVNGAYYYLDETNELYPGLRIYQCKKKIGDYEYVFENDGRMRTGWSKENGVWYYYDESGLLASGWRWVNGAWYYLEPVDNKMVEGCWKKINNSWYYLQAGGAMAQDWLYLNGNWYYMATDGAMKTGWQLVRGTWYYLYTLNDVHGGSEGVMARNTYIDGYYLSSSGAMMTREQSLMASRAQKYSSNTEWLVLVDRASCKVGVFRGAKGMWNLVNYWDCSPGKDSTPTVSGVFRVGIRGYYFDSGNARCYWYTQFYGNYLFHSVLYSKYNGSLIDGRLGMHLSHGCVRMDINNAKWIYDTIPSGSTVVVY